MSATKLCALLLGLLFSQGQAAPSPAANLTARSFTSVPRGVIIEHCTVPGVVALTFDDGPFIYTSQILDHLDAFNAKATFFINGENWSRAINDFSTPWPAVLRRIDQAGHQIGSHTWGHADLSVVDSGTREYQICELERALFEVLGKAPTYLRPPYGSCSFECLYETQQFGLHVVNFDVDPKDYMHNQPGDPGAMENFSRHLDERRWGDSFLVLSHDSLQYTAEALVPHMLREIQARGYRAVTVGECLGDPAENWYWTA
ncbi:carbohydrate esterase family 4 protein [Chaetomium sp. MPI-SDFR-AT-0129]|uniref:Carbohydrate esterase n=1 Tax=Dichotomopilus funicola TaxID=1934379 RepID=A0AAN6UZN5_9PEZI|nr:carbohydrate esterase family 4 protein [Chaetomium sp. MPI-SDFR-AT-0129]KAK4141420.1 carbohydrate esterase [Dichotomopilus funicola]